MQGVLKTTLIKHLSLAKTWIDVKQKFSQTPNFFSSFKKTFSALRLNIVANPF